jgi:hypothetical protein
MVRLMELSPFSTEWQLGAERRLRYVVEGVLSLEEAHQLAKLGAVAIACPIEQMELQQCVDLVAAAWELGIETLGVWSGEVNAQLMEWIALTGMTGVVIDGLYLERLRQLLAEYGMKDLFCFPRLSLSEQGALLYPQLLGQLRPNDWPIVEGSGSLEQLVPPRSPWLLGSEQELGSLLELVEKYKAQGIYRSRGIRTPDLLVPNQSR